MKIFMTLVMLFIAPLLFSASGQTINVGDSSIIVQLMTNSDMSSYDLGFSQTPVTQWSTKATPITSSISLAPILDPNSGEFYATLDESTRQEIYVYWRMYTLKTVTLNLKIGARMNNNKNQDKLDWYVDWADPNSSTSPKLSSKTAGNVVAVQKLPALLTLQGVAGSKKLDIYTDKLLEKSTVGTYSANLVLTVVVE